jgi:hypothetical protein
MAPEDIINYILIALIVIVAGNIIFKKMYMSDENIKNIASTNTICHVNLASEKERQKYYQQLNDEIDNNQYSTEIRSIASSKKSSDSLDSSNSDSCFAKTAATINELIPGDKYENQFFDEYVFNGRNKYVTVKFTDQEKTDFVNNYFSFRDHVWDSSRELDPVDEMNQQYLVENELNNDGTCGERLNTNKSIKDIFDSLTVPKKKLASKKIIEAGHYHKNDFENQFNKDESSVYDDSRIFE